MLCREQGCPLGFTLKKSLCSYQYDVRKKIQYLSIKYSQLYIASTCCVTTSWLRPSPKKENSSFVGNKFSCSSLQGKIIRLEESPCSSVEGCVWCRGEALSVPLCGSVLRGGEHSSTDPPQGANVSKDFHLHSLVRQGKNFLFQCWLRRNLCTLILNVFNLLRARQGCRNTGSS